jgi:N-acetyl-anhydromuramyl-L-alanine amidase AmpD
MMPRGSSSRRGTKINLISVHTSEGATTAAGLMHFLDQPGVEASYHVLVDDSTTIRYLPDDVAAWAMLSGNPRAVQVCLTGFARWPRSEWLSHDGMLRRGASVTWDWCLAHNIPPVKLTPAQVGADFPGICGHWDWTLGKKDGTHTDPGPNFPWDVFIKYVNPGGVTPSPSPPGPGSIPAMEYGQTNESIRRLQAFMNRTFPSYSHLPETSYYGDMTQAVIREFQHRVGIVDGDGRNVGPRTAVALMAHGFHG